jgi:hypothetical protein
MSVKLVSPEARGPPAVISACLAAFGPDQTNRRMKRS